VVLAAKTLRFPSCRGNRRPGDIESLHNLEVLLDETGRPDEAEQCL